MEVATILQHYRHDLMNRLQIVQGYVNMGKMDKVDTKLKEIFSYYNEERKLMNLNVPDFMVWIIEFNMKYDNFRLTYNIHPEYKNLHTSETLLIERCQHIMESLISILDSQVLYEVKLVMKEIADFDNVSITFTVSGVTDSDFDTLKVNRIENDKIDIEKATEGIVFTFSVPCQ